jgi:hypothetical protein
MAVDVVLECGGVLRDGSSASSTMVMVIPFCCVIIRISGDLLSFPTEWTGITPRHGYPVVGITEYSPDSITEIPHP